MPLADDLGVAMQLTNILRDIREDHARGRVYLPAEDLRASAAQRPASVPADAHGGADPLRGRARRDWFDRGLQLLELLDRTQHIVRAGDDRHLPAHPGPHRADPQTVLSRRISLPVWEKAWLAARSLAGARR